MPVLASLAAAFTAALLGAKDPPGRPPPRLDAVIERASAWVVTYGDALSSVIADERYTQTFDDGKGRRAARVLVSELALVRVSDRPEWVAFRDVIEVDGARVGDREDRLDRLFLERPAEALAAARAIADESARFNLGPVVRNFNVPTAALFFLHPSNHRRFRFRKSADVHRADGAFWRVAYEERDRPTLIRTPDGRSLPARGEFEIEPATGQVTVTTLRARDPARGLDVSCSVAFESSPALGLAVPATMRERYAGRGQLTEGEAVYSNYRRFRVETRIRN